MENAILIKIGAFLKWLISWLLPACVGSAIALVLSPQQSRIRTVSIFFAGVGISGYSGGAFIEYYAVSPGPMQAFVYMAIGMWGLGAVNSVSKELPELIKGLREKWLSK